MSQPSSSSSSSSSHYDEDDDDEEWIVSSSSGAAAGDREALVRQKLLESFYGKAAATTTTTTTGGGTAIASEAVNTSDTFQKDQQFDGASLEGSGDKINKHSRFAAGGSGNNINNKQQLNDHDPDAPHFDANAHTRHHIRSSSLQTLLETEERLALQVRTLDSTMQTMVYENYARFIDATDAIKSIGIHVQRHQSGLDQLEACLSRMDRTSYSLETAVGALRDQVVEKIRVQRLLQRLEALLQLPTTLRQHIAHGRYPQAAYTYQSTASILRQHSHKFASLQAIDTECQAILYRMHAMLQRKLWHWSGNYNAHSDHEYNASTTGTDENTPTDEVECTSSVPEPPQSMMEIVECARTLMAWQAPLPSSTMSLQPSSQQESDIAHEEDMEPTSAATTTEPLEWFEMAIGAAARALDRILDAHLIQVQDGRWYIPPSIDEDGDTTTTTATSTTPVSGESLIPREFLESLLEVTSLMYSHILVQNNNDKNDGSNATTVAAIPYDVACSLVQQFVIESFDSFLAHVRAVLLEETFHENDDDHHSSMDNGNDNTTNEPVHDRVSQALALLLPWVQDLANNVVQVGGLPSQDAARSILVDPVVDLTTHMVQRRVEHVFFHLRKSIVQECLDKMADRCRQQQQHKATKHNDSQTNDLMELVQIGNSTLSDCLQLVDDTIRSIFLSAGDQSGHNTEASSDVTILKEAVHQSSRRLAFWLASVVETLAGGDSSESKDSIEAPPSAGTTGSFMEDSKKDSGGDTTRLVAGTNDDDMESPGQLNALVKLMDAVVDKFSSVDTTSNGSPSIVILALVEMCRLAETSVSENFQQSIATHFGDKKKASHGLFPISATDAGQPSNLHDEISVRFRLAASRVLFYYSVGLGSLAGERLCSTLQMYDNISQSPDATNNPNFPSEGAIQTLKIVKTVLIHCSALLGGNLRAGPVPKMSDRSFASRGLSSSSYLSHKSTMKTSLHLDVARIFQESVPIYPHPSELLTFAGPHVVFLVLKTAIRAWLEVVRFHVFTLSSCKDIWIDVEFLRVMLSHYIDPDLMEQYHQTNVYNALSSMLSDVATTVLRTDSLSCVCDFLDHLDDFPSASTFVISDNAE
jgi:vacuolar protein sorting-associated protein 51